MMIPLPKGWRVTAGGRTWTSEIPEHLCPDFLKPAPPAPPATKREKQKEQE